MESHIVKILKIENVTHDVKRFKVEKPKGYQFRPGQATEVAINGREETVGKGPFTFTSLNEDAQLEFTIKIYNDGLTKELGKLKAGDELLIHDVWGAIVYQGPGVFIAGGAGVTPFIAILRQLYKDGKIESNRLIFSNKTETDIILKEEFEKILGSQFINVITKQKSEKYLSGRIDEEMIKNNINNFNQNFYICGPDEFVENINGILKKMGVPDTKIVVEE